MNIFFLDQSPDLSAANNCLKHQIKMPTEVANMLLWPFKLSSYELPLTQGGKLRKLSHLNHPASVWVRESLPNYEWALAHLWALCKEYSQHYGRVHDAHRLWRFCRDASSILDFSKDYLTPFPRCFSTFKEELDVSTQDTVKAYRKFYWLDKREFARWSSKDSVPLWWPDHAEKYIDKSFKEGKYIKQH